LLQEDLVGEKVDRDEESRRQSGPGYFLLDRLPALHRVGETGKEQRVEDAGGVGLSRPEELRPGRGDFFAIVRVHEQPAHAVREIETVGPAVETVSDSTR